MDLTTLETKRERTALGIGPFIHTRVAEAKLTEECEERCLDKFKKG